MVFYKNFIFFIFFFIVVFGCSTPQSLVSKNREQVVMIQSPTKADVQFEVTIFQPKVISAPDSPLVIINHGSNGNLKQDRDRPMSGVRFFNNLGMTVIVPMRQGYSNSTGKRALIKNCDLTAYALENAHDIEDIISWIDTQEQYKGRKIIMVGQSTGGLTSMAYSSFASNRASAIINFHGGVRPHSTEDCFWKSRVDAFDLFAKTSKPKSLWVYTANDHSSNPDYIAQLFDSFKKSGGQAELLSLPAFKDDGHYLFGDKDGESIWQPLVKYYLQEMNLLPIQ